MADLQIEPPEESEQLTSFGTKFLRFGAMFLCALLGLLLVLLGYMVAILLHLDLEEFNAYFFLYFSVSIVIWILVGLFTPFALFQRFFEELKGMTAVRVVVFALVIGTFVIVHWYVITFATQLLVSVFGGE
ncbi:MAG: hypothetical protein ABSA44_06875 [Bacteroidota bacterium]|jgi:hypothetical protein